MIDVNMASCRYALAAAFPCPSGNNPIAPATELEFFLARRTGRLSCGIEAGMKRLFATGVILMASLGLWAQTPGTFRGEVVRPPRNERSAGLIYLMGADGYVRRVVVTRAAIAYDAGVPAGDRKQSAKKMLVPGTEVRVTALLDSESGEWTASRVEVIAHHAARYEDDYDEDGNGRDSGSVPPAMASRTI
jgi:hypothetical protein